MLVDSMAVKLAPTNLRPTSQKRVLHAFEGAQVVEIEGRFFELKIRPQNLWDWPVPSRWPMEGEDLVAVWPWFPPCV